jgi:hypothetical protein
MPRCLPAALPCWKQCRLLNSPLPFAEAGSLINTGSTASPGRRLKATQLADDVPVTHGGVVAQARRGGGPCRALLAKALDAGNIEHLRWQAALT